MADQGTYDATPARRAAARGAPRNRRRLTPGAGALFDLNVEEILEHWGLPEAVREVIANALDEQALSGTAEPRIVKRSDGWHVTDFGRGLRYQHLTQNENEEKHRRPELVVGKFGVGLKDALATFHRRGVDVTVRSPHSDVTLRRAAKSNFGDVETLHAVVLPPSDPKRRGTDFVLGRPVGRRHGAGQGLLPPLRRRHRARSDRLRPGPGAEA